MRKPVRGLIVRTLAFTLAVIIVASGTAIAAPVAETAVSVSAPASGGKGMETALLTVKALVDIDESVYTDFSYSSTSSNQQTREGLVWNFNWSDTNSAYIYANVTDDGTLLSFSKNDYSKSTFGFAKISGGKAADLALAFLKKAAPDTYSLYSQKGEPVIGINNGEYSFSYVAKVNGHDFSAANIAISVNKFTGEVSYYYASNLNPNSYTFEAASKTISADAAVAAYADKIGLTLEYQSSYDYSSGKLSVFPVYLMAPTGTKYISAVTGNVVEYMYDRGQNDGAVNISAPQAMSETAADSGMGGSARLSPQEIAAVEKAKSFISSDAALEKLFAIMELPGVSAELFDESNVYLNKDYVNRDRYVYDISLYSNEPVTGEDGIYHISGRVDAETGRVLSFSHYSETNASGDRVNITEAQATETVEKFLKANAPDELKYAKLDSVQAPVEGRYYNTQSYYFSYYRTENGVPFRSNGISVMLDARTGKITSYSLNWYLKVSFPSIANVLAPQKALANYAQQIGIQTNYITVGDGKASLIYDFGAYAYIDPFTGKTVNYNGEILDTGSETPDYSDVKDHWSESYVNRLFENGVYAWGGKFEPERVMTQLEFLQYLMELEPWYQAEPLLYFTDHGIKTDIKADDKTPVTRQEAARIIAEYLGYGKLAEKYKWFAYPFTGAVDEMYKGYITVCCALGIITETGGEYNAKQGVTRAEAAAMLHNVILAKTEE